MLDELITRIKSLNRKRVLITGGVFLILFLVVLSLSFSSRSSSGNTPSSSTNPSGTSQPNFSSSNPSVLVHPESIENAKTDAYEQFQKEGLPTPTTVITRFHYTVDPNLSKKKSLLPQAYAQNTCNLDTAPGTVPIYTLKTNWSMPEAKRIASSFGISGNPTSLPVTGGYEYHFENTTTGDFLTYLPASGMYTYHQVIKNRNTPISQSQADGIIASELHKHSLSSSVSLTHAGFNATADLYHGFYIGNWPPFIVVDNDSLTSLKNQSVCSKKAASTVNDIRIFLANDGQLAKVINQIRIADQKLDAVRETLDDAVAEYQNDLPIAPIIIGNTHGSIVSGTVAITEATLVYYDYGDIFSQKMYLPVYITSGTATLSDGTQARIITIFPAVSGKELEKLGLQVARASSLKLASFTPIPTPPPTATPKPTNAPTAVPPTGGPTATPGPTQGPSAQAAGCPGGLVDYSARCDAGGTPVCSQFVSSPTDGWGVCINGCKSEEGTVTVDNANPCAAFFEQYSIPPSGKYSNSSGGTMTGTYHCIINACPC